MQPSTPKLSERLKAIIREHDLLQHPFYQAWSAGQLSQDTLRRYAVEYYEQVAAFPRFVSAVHSRCPEIDARKVLLQNLVDEELHGTDHPALWMQFAEGLGGSPSEVKAGGRLPETHESVRTFHALTRNDDWTTGLCALFAYEEQVPEVSASKIEGLKKFYGIQDERTLAFFQAHLKYDVEHARAVADLVDQYAEPQAAEHATREASKALWKFLDGMCREAGITCERH